MIKKVKAIIWKAFASVASLLRIMTLLAIMLLGIPMAYETLPLNSKPETVWEFANSVLLCYLVIFVTIQTFYENQDQ